MKRWWVSSSVLAWTQGHGRTCGCLWKINNNNLGFCFLFNKKAFLNWLIGCLFCQIMVMIMFSKARLWNMLSGGLGRCFTLLNIRSWLEHTVVFCYIWAATNTRNVLKVCRTSHGKHQDIATSPKSCLWRILPLYIFCSTFTFEIRSLIHCRSLETILISLFNKEAKSPKHAWFGGFHVLKWDCLGLQMELECIVQLS